MIAESRNDMYTKCEAWFKSEAEEGEMKAMLTGREEVQVSNPSTS